jgi:homoserine O-succinyltransferase
VVAAPRGPVAPALVGGTRALRCALVNNMPDAALVATEHQFLGLVAVGAGAGPVEVRRYSLAGVPRGRRASAHLQAGYLPLDQLWGTEPDILIVTGSEPLAEALVDEPYWGEFVELLAWASARPMSVLLSCLAAHAALLALDGLQRTRLPGKCSGVFAHDLAPESRLTDGMDRPALMPHSRLNDVPTAAVATSGWDVVMTSPIGWGAITARRAKAEFLLLQGHPEYAPGQLLREYRRDVMRYLRGERSSPPEMAGGSVAPTDEAALARFHRGVVAGRTSIDAFPFDQVGARAPGAWRGVAESLYINWIAGLAAHVLEAQ